MSSFVGHGLAALTVHVALHAPELWGRDRVTTPAAGPLRSCKLRQAGWMLGLIAIAWAPDLDHWLPWLHQSAHNDIRITHSILGTQLLPLLTIAALYCCGLRAKALWNLGLQAGLAGFSQVVLDIAVGIAGLPIFWPLSLFKLKSPIGLLPSAGALDLGNYYFYYNLGIELGVLLPISLVILFWRWGDKRFQPWIKVVFLGCAIATSLSFMHWASQLSR